MVFPEQQQQYHQQQQNAWADQRGLQPPYKMHPEMGAPYTNSVTYDYPKQQNNFNMGPHTIIRHTAPATITTFAPWHDVQQNMTAPAPGRHSLPASAQAAHPSDVFGALDEAMAAMPPSNWCCPINDVTLPATYQDRQQWAQLLLNAVNNVTDIQGKEDEAFKKRWLVDPLTGLDYYLPLDKSILCWTVIDLAERMHRFGPSVLHSFDEVLWESARWTSNWTFQHRMYRVIELLTVSKTRCNSLLGGTGLQSIVANPDGIFVATKFQAKQNEQRSKILKIGQAAKKLKTSAHE